VDVLVSSSLIVLDVTATALSPVTLLLLGVDQEKDDGTLAEIGMLRGTVLQVVTGEIAFTVTAGTTLTVNVNGVPVQVGLDVLGVIV
jgi:hypothetical protein